MTRSSRRTFLQTAISASLAAAFPASIKRALALPGNHRTGTLRDVEHIVILTQENRSFDHFFGTLRGVRGFGDPQAVRLPNGHSVLEQPDPTHPTNTDGFLRPFRLGDVPGGRSAGLRFLNDVAHGWTDSHSAFNDGKYDNWVPAKGTNALTYLTRSDIPFHYALADAFTVCDAYYCSVLGPTDPNRYHLWTGFTGNNGSTIIPPGRTTPVDGPVVDNSEEGYSWSTYPEQLDKAGISWKIYQDIGEGLDQAHFWGFTDNAYIGNFGDNEVLYFLQYHLHCACRSSRARFQGTRSDGPLPDITPPGPLRQLARRAATKSRRSLDHRPRAHRASNWPVDFGAGADLQVLTC
jgi:phospholipase C